MPMGYPGNARDPCLDEVGEMLCAAVEAAVEQTRIARTPETRAELMHALSRLKSLVEGFRPDLRETEFAQ
jgi:hypothetical protein